MPEFGYPWWLSYGHVVVAVPALLLLLFGYYRKWSRTAMVLVGAVALWSIAAFAVARFGLNVNGRLALPTQRFLASGTGRVLDMGCGTGRSTLMVLETRPQATVVALDLFGESYAQHFGPRESGQQRLLRNLKSVGVADRATIVTADMRQLPFAPATFDAIVSTYAIDHLGRKGAGVALSEAARVLKPGGEFLMMVIHKDAYLNFTFGPLLLHSGTRDMDWWSSRLRDAGFQVIEQGRRPATICVLARKT